MKRLLCVIALLVGLAAGAQAQLVSLKAFPEPSIGAKLTDAQTNACNPATTCVIVIEPELSGFNQGSLPTPCVTCIWLDWRNATTGPQFYFGQSATAVVLPTTISGIVNVFPIIDLPSGGGYCWASSGGNSFLNPLVTPDACIWRNGAGAFNFGTNSQGDLSGFINLAGITRIGGVVTVNQGVPAENQQAVSTTQSGNLSSQTAIATTPASTTQYRINLYVVQIGAGSGCTGAATVVPTVTFTDPNAAGTTTVTLGTFTLNAGGNNGTANAPGTPSGTVVYYLRTKASTSVTYAATFTGGAGCATQPTYQLAALTEKF